MQKPPIGSTIDLSHPLSQGLVGCWLFNEGSGKAGINIVSKKTGTIVSDATLTNQGLVCTVNTGGLSVDTFPFMNGNTSYTIFSIINFTTIPVYGVLFGISNTCILFMSSSNQLTFKNGNWSSDRCHLIGFGVTGRFSVAGVLNTNKNQYAVYKNGVAGNVGVTGLYNPVYDLTGAWSIGASSNLQGSAGTIIETVLFYNRALSPDEIKSLNDNPYQFILTKPQSPILTYRKIPYNQVRFL